MVPGILRNSLRAFVGRQGTLRGSWQASALICGGIAGSAWVLYEISSGNKDVIRRCSIASLNNGGADNIKNDG